MSAIGHNGQPTPFHELASELGLAIGRDANFNNEFETFIARCDPNKTEVSSLELSLNECRKATERLAELYRLIRDLAPYENEVRALHARAVDQSQRGPSAAA